TADLPITVGLAKEVDACVVRKPCDGIVQERLERPVGDFGAPFDVGGIGILPGIPLGRVVGRRFGRLSSPEESDDIREALVQNATPPHSHFLPPRAAYPSKSQGLLIWIEGPRLSVPPGV